MALYRITYIVECMKPFWRENQCCFQVQLFTNWALNWEFFPANTSSSIWMIRLNSFMNSCSRLSFIPEWSLSLYGTSAKQDLYDKYESFFQFWCHLSPSFRLSSILSIRLFVNKLDEISFSFFNFFCIYCRRSGGFSRRRTEVLWCCNDGEIDGKGRRPDWSHASSMYFL